MSSRAQTKQRWSFTVFDFFALGFSIVFAFFLRLGWPIKPLYFEFLKTYIVPFLLVKFAIFYGFGLYRSFWRYASIHELRILIQGVVASSVAVLILSYAFGTLPIPRSVFVVDGLLTLFLVGGSRFAGRTLSELYQFARAPAGARRVLIVGAGDAGEMLVREMLKSPELDYLPIGFIDDNVHKSGIRVHGVKVLGTRDDLETLVQTNDVKEIIIAMPSADRRVNEDIVNICERLHVTCRTLPGIYDVIDGRVGISSIRDVRIEDILGRDPVKVNMGEIGELVSGRTVLITGAGGSIGSELCRQISYLGPELLLQVDINENLLYEIERELTDAGSQVVSLLVDIKNEQKTQEIFDLYRPHLVFHAAAYKHVPMMELNPLVALENNFAATLSLARQAAASGTEKFVLVSTDKAVNPVNTLGISKALAERSVLGLSGQGTEFIVVRFGNVLASNGSVVPLFQKQIASGGPITITHPDMKRYLMTITESVQLILQAASFGASDDVYVLDMGEQVSIVELADKLVRLSGLNPGEIEFRYIGVRPGEKMEEELVALTESKRDSAHSKIFIINSRENIRSGEMLDRLDAIAYLVRERRLPEALTGIGALLSVAADEFREQYT